MARIHTNQSRGNFRYSCSFVPFVATSSAGCVSPTAYIRGHLRLILLLVKRISDARESVPPPPGFER
jgi:hypothetical protein